MPDVLLAILLNLDVKSTLWAFFLKFGALFFYVLLGIAGKFALMLVQGQKISLWYAVGTAIMSGFVGFLACVWCLNNSPTSAPYVVPIATLSSDKIMTALGAINWSAIIDTIFKRK